MEISYKVIFLLFTLFILLIGGTFIFHELEGWSYVDSFYFSTITLTTIGYGDLHPVRSITKILVSFYALYGVAIMLYILTLFISEHMQRQERRFFSYLSRIKTNRVKMPFKKNQNPFRVVEKPKPKSEYIEIRERH